MLMWSFFTRLQEVFGQSYFQLWKGEFHSGDNLECCTWPVKSSSFFPDLDACRLIVNIYKYGDGLSLKQLTDRYPDKHYIEHPFNSLPLELPASWRIPHHDDLKITDEHLDQFSDAIVQFWRAVPETVLTNQIQELPEWFKNAIEKDRKQREGNT